MDDSEYTFTTFLQTVCVVQMRLPGEFCILYVRLVFELTHTFIYINFPVEWNSWHIIIWHDECPFNIIFYAIAEITMLNIQYNSSWCFHFRFFYFGFIDWIWTLLQYLILAFISRAESIFRLRTENQQCSICLQVCIISAFEKKTLLLLVNKNVVLSCIIYVTKPIICSVRRCLYTSLHSSQIASLFLASLFQIPVMIAGSVFTSFSSLNEFETNICYSYGTFNSSIWLGVIHKEQALLE